MTDSSTKPFLTLSHTQRKTTPLTGREKLSCKKRERSESSASESGTKATVPVNPVLVNILHRSSSGGTTDTDQTKSFKVASGKGIKHPLNGYLKGVGAPTNNSHIAVAKAAVGKGIRHGYASAAPSESHDTAFTFKDPHQLGMDVESSLSELSNNFRNSMKDTPSDPLAFGMLSRNSSLIDLAMLDPIEPTPVSELQRTSDPNLMSFLDFPSSQESFPPLDS